MTWEWESDRRENPPDRPYSRTLPRPDHGLDYLMANYLQERGLSWDLAVTNWWYPSRTAGDASPRIVMPATSHIPGNVYWQARAMDGNPKRYQSPYAPRGDAVIVCWPPDRTLRSAVVEGPMDALAAAETGTLGVALMGATPSTDALELTSQLVHGTICVVVADSDAIGPASRFLSFLASRGVSCRIQLPAPYKDLAEMPLDERMKLLA